MSCSDNNSPAYLRHITSYAAASMRLRLRAWDDGGDGVLRNVQVNLCEDLKTAMIWATHKNGSDLYASFELPAPTTEEHFDASEYVAALQGDETEAEKDGKTSP